MTDSILPNERKWELPTGNLIRFDSKDDLEYFIRQCNFSYDEVLNCIPGVTCEIDDPCEINLDYNDNDGTATASQQIEEIPTDWECKILNILPIFVNDDDYYLEHMTANTRQQFTHIIKKIEVDTKIWQFPVVAYINFDGFSSRMGETTIQIFNITPVNQIPTIESFKIKEQKFGDIWVNNLQNEIDLEQRVLAAEAKGVNI
jgi:hypothetical protein